MALKVSQQVPASLKVVDRYNNPVGSLDGPASWSADPALLSLNVAPDGLSADVVPVGPLGSAQLNVSGLSGGKPVSGSLVIDLVAGDAVSLSIELGVPVDKP